MKLIVVCDKIQALGRPLVSGRGLKHFSVVRVWDIGRRPLVSGRGLKPYCECRDFRVLRRPLVSGRGLKLLEC